MSLIYLGYHIAGFWWGWIVRIRPRLSKSHCVVGDRYSYDLFLDPRRFRLKLPSSVCRMAALLAPKPAVTIGLVASPEVIHARKPELTIDEISAYQDRWRSLCTDRPGMRTVSADGTASEVILRVKQAILNEVIGR